MFGKLQFFISSNIFSYFSRLHFRLSSNKSNWQQWHQWPKYEQIFYHVGSRIRVNNTTKSFKVIGAEENFRLSTLDPFYLSWLNDILKTSDLRLQNLQSYMNHSFSERRNNFIPWCLKLSPVLAVSQLALIYTYS